MLCNATYSKLAVSGLVLVLSILVPHSPQQIAQCEIQVPDAENNNQQHYCHVFMQSPERLTSCKVGAGSVNAVVSINSAPTSQWVSH